jgi:hypothetical protein
MRFVLVVIAVAASACNRPLFPLFKREPAFATPPPSPAAAAAPPSARPPAERAVDGRAIVYGDEALWCYLDNDGVAGGDCADVMATCESYRQTAITNSVVFTIGKLKQEFGFEKAKQQAIESALKRWRRCAPTFVAACFYWTDVLSNVEVRMCNPTLAACEHDRTESRLDPGLVLRDDGCVVYRVRRPAERENAGHWWCRVGGRLCSRDRGECTRDPKGIEFECEPRSVAYCAGGECFGAVKVCELDERGQLASRCLATE